MRVCLLPPLLVAMIITNVNAAKDMLGLIRQQRDKEVWVEANGMGAKHKNLSHMTMPTRKHPMQKRH